MPLIRLHKKKSHQWGIWQIEESLDELLSTLEDSVCKSEISTFASTQRKLEYITSRVLIKHLLGEEKKVVYQSSGKPYLLDHSYEISVSHSGKFVAVIVSGTYGVSIDIERYAERIDDLISRFMRVDEYASLYKGTEIWSYLLHWSAKEVLYKILNKQNIDFKKHLKIDPFQTDTCGIMSAKETRTKAQKQFNIEYKIHPEFVLTWCVDKP